MQSHEPATGAPDAAEKAHAAAAASSLGDGYIANLRALVTHSAALARELLKLFGAETRLTLGAMVMILALVVVGSFLIAMIWLFLGGALAWWMVQSLQLSPVVALLCIGGVSLILLLAIALWIRSLTRHLQFRHTRESLAKLWPSTPVPPSNETR